MKIAKNVIELLRNDIILYDKVNLDIIKEEIKILPNYENQICLQGTKDNLDPFFGCGLFPEKEELKNLTEKDFNVFIFDTPYLNSIIKKHNLYRVRLMKLKPSNCYFYHQDWSKRFHIPIKTNDKCFFILDGEVIHLKADGSCYLIDTTKKHTALNGSREDRLHLVGVI
jgi:hypothetical protein